jgi:hypothetical protein
MLAKPLIFQWISAPSQLHNPLIINDLVGRNPKFSVSHVANFLIFQRFSRVLTPGGTKFDKSLFFSGLVIGYVAGNVPVAHRGNWRPLHGT